MIKPRNQARHEALKSHTVYNLVVWKLNDAIKQGEFELTLVDEKLNCLVENREPTDICIALLNELVNAGYRASFDKVNKILKIQWH